jgi:hypothetical protein
MHRIFIALLLGLPALALGDRISDMNRTERCVYKARLSVAGYHYFLQGRARDAVVIHWHGDETPDEVEFVTRTLDEVYARAAALQQGRAAATMSEQDFGDRAYDACMTGETL